MSARLRIACLLVIAPAGAWAAAVADEAVDFERDVRPILAAHCFACHGADAQESGLRLDHPATIRQGGNSGALVAAGKSDDSLLIKAVVGQDTAVVKMPPDGPPLAAEQVAVLRRWIDAGARLPEGGPAPAAARRSSDHWAFQPVGRFEPPRVRRADWVRNPLDAFVLARLEAAGLEPAPEADQATLARRASLDLLGLPPSLAEVDAFLADGDDGAYERLVDRLLASPHYGERWGRHWLDLARYADSNGYTIDSGRSIWKYRDWVIEALNRDMPFDQFAIEQLAGDMLPGAGIEQRIATGFHRNTMVNEEGGTDDEQFRVEAVVDRVSTTGAAFLGLTLGCARCHDHKYDPISQREFYELFALFNGADEPTLQVPTDQQAKEMPALRAEIEQVETRIAMVDESAGGRQADWEARLRGRLNDSSASADAERQALPDAVRQALLVPAAERSDEQSAAVRKHYQSVDPERQPLTDRLAALVKQQKQMTDRITTTLVMQERAEPRPTFLHVRGDFLSPGAAVVPDVPDVLPPLVPRGERADRLDFARWIVDRNNPLTPRVTVNRVWQAYFGTGLVATENDFGLQGEKPTHPELLDWLAAQLIDGGWSLKSLHRLIVTSNTYRQSSAARADLQAADPYNKLLGRQARLRLEAETIRDAALAASGRLAREIGGPGVYPPQPEGIYAFTQQKKFWGEKPGSDRYRRGLYTYLWRSSPYPFLKTFDVPDAVVACTRRARSNTPLQALTLANDRAFFEIAQGFGGLMAAGSGDGDDDRARLRAAFRRALVREPAAGEIDNLLAFLENERSQFAAAPGDAARAAGLPADAPHAVEAAAWTMVARVLFNVDEFVTRE